MATSRARARRRRQLSVLFSEPKIPQLLNERDVRWAILDFQCSSASRKFLNNTDDDQTWVGDDFQCSSASRKFLNTPFVKRD